MLISSDLCHKKMLLESLNIPLSSLCLNQRIVKLHNLRIVNRIWFPLKKKITLVVFDMNFKMQSC